MYLIQKYWFYFQAASITPNTPNVFKKLMHVIFGVTLYLINTILIIKCVFCSLNYIILCK